jgi:hypothetical protein
MLLGQETRDFTIDPFSLPQTKENLQFLFSFFQVLIEGNEGHGTCRDYALVIAGFQAGEEEPQPLTGRRPSVRKICERSSPSSPCRSLAFLPDTAIGELVLLFGKFSPTRRQEFLWFGRDLRGAQVDPEELLHDA